MTKYTLKLISAIMAVVLMLSMTACGQKAQQQAMALFPVKAQTVENVDFAPAKQRILDDWQEEIERYFGDRRRAEEFINDGAFYDVVVLVNDSPAQGYTANVALTMTVFGTSEDVLFFSDDMLKGLETVTIYYGSEKLSSVTAIDMTRWEKGMHSMEEQILTKVTTGYHAVSGDGTHKLDTVKAEYEIPIEINAKLK